MTANQQGQAGWLREWHAQQKKNNPNYDPSWAPKTGWRGWVNDQSPPQPGVSAPGRNAPTTNQQGQAGWLKAWTARQRAKPNSNWNASWVPKTGWRHRANVASQAAAAAPPPPSTGVSVPAPPAIPHYVPPPPPPPPPGGFNTAAPTNVPPGEWRGGTIVPEGPATGVSVPVPKDMFPTDPIYAPGYGPQGWGYPAGPYPSPPPSVDAWKEQMWAPRPNGSQARGGAQRSWAPPARGMPGQAPTNAMRGY